MLRDAVFRAEVPAEELELFADHALWFALRVATELAPLPLPEATGNEEGAIELWFGMVPPGDYVN